MLRANTSYIFFRFSHKLAINVKGVLIHSL